LVEGVGERTGKEESGKLGIGYIEGLFDVKIWLYMMFFMVFRP
jgi:hypothetical protein